MSLPTKITLRSGDWNSVVRNLQVWVDSVTNILHGNTRLGDQVGTLYQFTWNSANPQKIRLSNRIRPQSVVCQEASLPGGSTSRSMVEIEWDWHSDLTSSTVRVVSAPTLALATDYQMTLVVYPGSE